VAAADRGAVPEVVPKRKLSRTLLRRLWEERAEPLADPRS
jgi:hypothetical protein